MTWDAPGAGPFTTQDGAGGSGDFVHDSTYQIGTTFRYSVRALVFQAVSDATPYDMDIDSVSALFTWVRLLRVTPTPGSDHPHLNKYQVYRWVNGSGTELFSLRGTSASFDNSSVLHAVNIVAAASGSIQNWGLPFTVPAGSHLVLEAGVYSYAIDTGHEGSFDGKFEIGDASGTDLSSGDTNQHNSWGQIQNYLYTPGTSTLKPRSFVIKPRRALHKPERVKDSPVTSSPNLNAMVGNDDFYNG